MSRDPFEPPKERAAAPKPANLWAWIVGGGLALMVLLMVNQGRPPGEILGTIAPVLLYLVVIFYLYLPLKHWKTYWLAMRTAIREVDWTAPETPREFATGCRSMTEALVPLGYTDRGQSHLEGMSALEDGYAAFFEDRSARTVARFAIFRKRRRGTSALREVLIFSTRFADGSEVMTTNNRDLPLAPPKPGRHRSTFPEVRDPAPLHALHVRAIRQLGEFSARVEPTNSGPSGHAAFYDEEMAYLVHLRYLRPDEVRGVYRPTLKGAFLMVWRQLWPWSLIARAALKREARKATHEERGQFA